MYSSVVIWHDCLTPEEHIDLYGPDFKIVLEDHVAASPTKATIPTTTKTKATAPTTKRAKAPTKRAKAPTTKTTTPTPTPPSTTTPKATPPAAWPTTSRLPTQIFEACWRKPSPPFESARADDLVLTFDNDAEAHKTLLSQFLKYKGGYFAGRVLCKLDNMLLNPICCDSNKMMPSKLGIDFQRELEQLHGILTRNTTIESAKCFSEMDFYARCKEDPRGDMEKLHRRQKSIRWGLFYPTSPPEEELEKENTVVITKVSVDLPLIKNDVQEVTSNQLPTRERGDFEKMASTIAITKFNNSKDAFLQIKCMLPATWQGESPTEREPPSIIIKSEVGTVARLNWARKTKCEKNIARLAASLNQTESDSMNDKIRTFKQLQADFYVMIVSIYCISASMLTHPDFYHDREIEVAKYIMKYFAAIGESTRKYHNLIKGGMKYVITINKQLEAIISQLLPHIKEIIDVIADFRPFAESNQLVEGDSHQAGNNDVTGAEKPNGVDAIKEEDTSAKSASKKTKKKRRWNKK
ncbi:hypothetical protein KGF57_004090 [Candida theae]|uniref:Uncharacterized protein n=1 Tax=Candida theae TaxID=1198502 RepID=A0AAD5BBW6_9ASCO|nr:uncharacterized protein KGF57_004090 [Candida theae]KAI5952974.1 hypothetical protein KGF57_004090 [Candida theae]